MFTKIDLWNTFIAQVEGSRSNPSRVALIREKLVWAGIELSDKKLRNPDLQLLADLLRSKRKLPQKVRNWLADLMDPNASSEFKKIKLSKSKRGPNRKILSGFSKESREALCFYDGEIESRSAVKNATTDTMKNLGISKSTLAKYKSDRNKLHKHIGSFVLKRLRLGAS